MQVLEFTPEKNDDAQRRLLAHLLAKFQSRQLTHNMYNRACSAAYDAFDPDNTDEQTWHILVAQAKAHGLDLESAVTA